MIRIIEHGKKLFVGTCARCGCKFSYNLGDLGIVSYVVCPECGEKCYHPRQDMHSPCTDYMPLNNFDQLEKE